jgi:hypothetical protein
VIVHLREGTTSDDEYWLLEKERMLRAFLGMSCKK